MRTRAGMAAAASAAVFVVYLVWLAAGGAAPPAERPISSLLLIAFSVAAAVLSFRLSAAAGTFDRGIRRAWLLIGLSAASNAAAEAVWFGLETILKQDPFPSGADLFYLAYYPLRLAGIMALPFATPRRSERPTLWLDMGIVIAAGSIGLWYFLAAPLWVGGQIDGASLVALSYPVADVIVLAGLVILAEREVELARLPTVVLLALNIVLVSVADTSFALLESRSLPATPAPLNALWTAAALCDLLAVCAMLALGQRWSLGSHRPSQPARRFLRLTMPYLATILGLAVLVIAALDDPPRAYLIGTLFGALVLMALAMLRQFVVLRENMQLQEEASRLATIDSLTGLSNRRTLDDALEKEVERALRYTHPLTVVMLDVDGFKSFNDRHGHLEGDAALRRICAGLRTQVRTTDLLARFGGDEFVLLLPETTWEGAVAVGAKMRQSIRELLFDGTQLGLSIGAAEYRPGMTPHELLTEADRSLYRDKRGLRQLTLEAAEPASPSGGPPIPAGR